MLCASPSCISCSASCNTVLTWSGKQTFLSLARPSSLGEWISISSKSSLHLAGTLVYDCGCRYIRVIVASSVRVDKSNMQSDLLVRASGAPDSAWSNRHDKATIRNSSTCDRKRSHVDRSSLRIARLLPSTKKFGSNSAYTRRVEEGQQVRYTKTHVSNDGSNRPSVSIDGFESSDADAADRRRRSVRSTAGDELLLQETEHVSPNASSSIVC